MPLPPNIWPYRRTPMRDSGDNDGATAPPVIVAETTAAILAAGTVIDGWSRLVALLAGMLILLSLAT